MKKLTSLLLVIVLTTGLCTFAFAEAEEPVRERKAYMTAERPLTGAVVSDEDREIIRRMHEEIRELRETIGAQQETLREKFTQINQLREEALRNKDWETLKTIREYRRINIRIRISILELRYARMDIFDLLDEARQAQDVQMFIGGLEQLIENLRGVVELNDQAIVNADACIEEVS
jgi:uncharacterized membrane protein